MATQVSYEGRRCERAGAPLAGHRRAARAGMPAAPFTAASARAVFGRVPMLCSLAFLAWLGLVVSHLGQVPPFHLVMWSAVLLTALAATMVVWVSARHAIHEARQARGFAGNFLAVSLVLGASWAATVYFLGGALIFGDQALVPLMVLAGAGLMAALAVEMPASAAALALPGALGGLAQLAVSGASVPALLGIGVGLVWALLAVSLGLSVMASASALSLSTPKPPRQRDYRDSRPLSA